MCDGRVVDLLQRYGQIEAKLGEVRLEFNHTVTRKFIEPFATYTGAYENASVVHRTLHVLIPAARPPQRPARAPRAGCVQGAPARLEEQRACGRD